MRFLILGATGPSGLLLVRQALVAYPQGVVVIYARSPEKLPADLATNPSVIVVKGPLEDLDALENALQGVDVILSALGPGPWHPSDTPLAKGYSNLIDLMHKHNIKRLLCLGTASITDEHDKFSLIFKALVTSVSTLAHNAYKDVVAIGDIVRTKGEDLDWTIVRVPILTNTESRAVVGGYIGDGKVGTLLPRLAFAVFMVEEVEKREWVKKAPMISAP